MKIRGLVLGLIGALVVALMDALGVARATVVGNSLGGYVAWKTAVDHPDRVARLVLVDAAGYAYQSQSTPIAFKLARNPTTAPIMAHLSSRRTVESSLRDVYGDPSRVTPDLVYRYSELALRAGNRAAIAARFAHIEGGEYEAQISQLKQPTLILRGGRDRLIPRTYADRFQAEITGSELVVFEELGHVPQEEDPAGTVRALIGFLDAPR
jgi:pimeloyl-ACP methyl ester carboxylesterase